jgi:glycosyltransferase involved in cell wall biosynthesis
MTAIPAPQEVEATADALGSGSLRVVYLDHCAGLSGGELALARLLPALTRVQPHVLLAEHGPLVERLRAAGIAVEVLTMADNARNLRKDRIRAASLPLGAAWCSATYVLRLARRLRALQPDLVHTNSLKSALYGGVAGRMVGIPVVWHVRDRIARDYLPSLAVRLVRVSSRLLPRAVIANSRATLATLPNLGRRSCVVPSPVAAVAGAHPQADVAPGAGLTVGMIGRLSPWKGQHVFVEAFARAFPGEPGDLPARSVVVGAPLFGEDGYAHQLEALAAGLHLGSRIEFAGFIEDVAGCLTTFDILVHASVVPEPFGNVVVEGMAAGLPVVAAGQGGPAEIIDDGVNGILYPPGDIDALAAALRALAASPGLRHRLGEAARERAAEFTPDRVASRIMDVYRDALTAS